MNILISNDDGVFAPGILAAKQAVEDLADVTVVAPDKNNSSVGRRLTLFKHLKIESCELEDKSRACRGRLLGSVLPRWKNPSPVHSEETT